MEESATTTNLKTEALCFSDKFITASELHGVIAWQSDIIKCVTKTTHILLSVRRKIQDNRGKLWWEQTLEMRPLRLASGRLHGVTNTYFVPTGFESNFRYKRLREYSHLFAYVSFNDS